MSRTLHKGGMAGRDGRHASQHRFRGPFFLSVHAVERFRERVAPGLHARRTSQGGERGEVWEADGGIRFVVKRDGGMLVAVTCYGPDDRESTPELTFEAAAE